MLLIEKIPRILYAVPFIRKNYKLTISKKTKKEKGGWRSATCAVDNGTAFGMGANTYFVSCNFGYCASTNVATVTCNKETGFDPPFKCDCCSGQLTRPILIH